MKQFYSIFLLLCLTSTTFIFGQKAKFGGDICAVQKLRLPHNYSEPNQRTFDLVKKGIYATDIDVQSKKIYGWTPDSEAPNVRAVISIYGFSVSSPNRKSEEKQKKDKDGKVTDRWKEYWYEGSATGRATLYIYGLNQPFEYRKNQPSSKSKAQQKSKWEEKQEARAEAEKKDLEDNPFLSKEVIEEAEESDIGDDEGLANSELALVNTYRIDRVKEIKTKRHRSGSDAYKDYAENHRPELRAYRDFYPSEAYQAAISRLNSLYGYGPVVYRFYMRKMKNEKHPEMKTWNDACQATETIFKTFKYGSSIEDKQEQFEPIINYFAGQVDKIAEEDKKNRKQKKAAYQNLLNILYYLDRHDDVIIWTNKFLGSKKLDKISKRQLQKSERLKAHLEFHGLSYRHIESEEEIDIEDMEVEAEEVFSDEEGQ